MNLSRSDICYIFCFVEGFVVSNTISI